MFGVSLLSSAKSVSSPCPSIEGEPREAGATRPLSPVPFHLVGYWTAGVHGTVSPTLQHVCTGSEASVSAANDSGSLLESLAFETISKVEGFFSSSLNNIWF